MRPSAADRRAGRHLEVDVLEARHTGVRQDDGSTRLAPRLLAACLRRDGARAARARGFLGGADRERGERAAVRRLPAAVAAGVLTRRYSPSPPPAPAWSGVAVEI